jgi:hypothetical protein
MRTSQMVQGFIIKSFDFIWHPNCKSNIWIPFRRTLSLCSILHLFLHTFMLGDNFHTKNQIWIDSQIATPMLTWGPPHGDSNLGPGPNWTSPPLAIRACHLLTHFVDIVLNNMFYNFSFMLN